MATRLTVAELVDLGDLDELLRRVDELCDGGDWAGLLDLRDRSRVAFERGRQLWPAASHAEYRLALQAPGRWAAQVVQPGAARFALGPLSEVAASTHSWDELAPHLAPTPEAALVAQERVLRGEDLRGDVRVDAAAAELPLVLHPLEPQYPLATYQPYKAEFPDAPPPAAWETVEVPGGAAAGAGGAGGGHGTGVLLELVTPWTTQSNGKAAAVAVEGDVLDALGALGAGAQARLVAVEGRESMAVMAWAGASGGAHGRRRGMAQGRFGAWWTAATLAGVDDEWPAVGGAWEDGVRWYRWDRAEPSTGWSFRLAAERVADRRAWAVEATDQR